MVKLLLLRQHPSLKLAKTPLYLIALCLVLFCGSCKPTPNIQIHTIENEKPGKNSSLTESKQPVIRITNGEWDPYAGHQLPGFGCDSRLISETFADIGYKVEYGFFPWARAYELAKIGDWDGTMEWDDTPDHRSDFYINSEPISEQEWVFYYLKDSPFEWNSIDDLTGKTIGVTSGYVYSDVFKELSDTGKTIFEEASSDQANFNKLLTGRIDIFPMEKNVGHSLIKKYFSPEEQLKFTYHPNKLHTFNTYLLLTKTNPGNAKLIDEFNKKLVELKKSPRYEIIMKDCFD